jgi:hypothetical protein
MKPSDVRIAPSKRYHSVSFVYSHVSDGIYVNWGVFLICQHAPFYKRGKEMNEEEKPPPITEEHFNLKKLYQIIIKMGQQIMEEKNKEEENNADDNERPLSKR